MNFDGKQSIVEKIHNDESEYIRKLIDDIKELNKVTGSNPVFKEENAPRLNKFGVYSKYLVDENGIRFSPDNSRVSGPDEPVPYFVWGKRAKQIGPKDGYSLHAYIWMRTRESLPPKGWEIHHKDGNHFNNSPENLVCIPRSIHILLDMRSKEIKRTRKLTEKEEQIVNAIYDMEMLE